MIYNINGKVVTKEEWDALPSRNTPGKAPNISSVKPFVSPIDGSIISTRAGLKAHEREHNVIQVGDEYVGLVSQKREEQRQLKSDMQGRVREAERNGMQDNSNFRYL